MPSSNGSISTVACVWRDIVRFTRSHCVRKRRIAQAAVEVFTTEVSVTGGCPHLGATRSAKRQLDHGIGGIQFQRLS